MGTLLLIAAASLLIMRFHRDTGEVQTVDMNFTLCGVRGSQGCVIDGDTFMIGRRKIRLAGYNAPEMKGDCAAEVALARQSRDALRDWLNQGTFAMSGGDEPPFDQYGRELRSLTRGDDALADMMIERGLAQESGWGFERGGWCD
ncbi:thermonuclease family protein [Pontixanthobacter aquaemixtae]|uniref:Thermonuclease family protein n=1 Tax=Pontixanthobacter aquaemixtae TaxID=1958940 RepID=A0A844ZWR6_9SPHN|nr:thermonuclease family protein [Pontixanthobacter aquaemixtae]MXO91682.1 thermonuclease family protein [Pontixanthobacter aquaemixtae]